MQGKNSCTSALVSSLFVTAERKAFLLVASGGKSVNRVKAPIAEDLTLNLYRQEDSLFTVGGGKQVSTGGSPKIAFAQNQKEGQFFP